MAGNLARNDDEENTMPKMLFDKARRSWGACEAGMGSRSEYEVGAASTVELQKMCRAVNRSSQRIEEARPGLFPESIVVR